jgi:3'-5' exoribonuclease
MTRLFVKDLKIGQAVDEIFFVNDAEWSEKNGGSIFFRLGDRTGTVNAKWWDKPHEPEGLSEWGFVRAKGEIIEYPRGSGRPQLRCDWAIRVETPEDMSDFEAVAVIPIGELNRRYAALIAKISVGPVPALAKLVIACIGPDFMQFPAAIKIHHATRHGLLQHTVEVAEMAMMIATQRNRHGYEQVNVPVLIAGALLHDFAKTLEYRSTVNGVYECGPYARLGHIALAIWHITSRAVIVEDLAEEDLLDVLHIVASHHGTNEHGSPVEPQTPEAVIVSHADALSTDLYIHWDAREKHTGNDCYARSIRGFVYCPQIKDEDGAVALEQESAVGAC